MNKGVKHKLTGRSFDRGRICFIIFFLFAFFFECKKDKDDIPDVYVDIYLYQTDPAFSTLNSTGGYAYLTGGSKGILVYRKSFDEFTAYDRHCTYKAADGNTLTVDASGLLVIDTVCTSKFLITDGTPNQGPAINPLKRYQTAWDGTVLHIFN